MHVLSLGLAAAQQRKQSSDTNSTAAASLVTPKYASVINAMPCLHNWDNSHACSLFTFPWPGKMPQSSQKPLGGFGHIFQKYIRFRLVLCCCSSVFKSPPRTLNEVTTRPSIHVQYFATKVVSSKQPGSLSLAETCYSFPWKFLQELFDK